MSTKENTITYDELSPLSCACSNTRRTARWVSEAYDKKLSPAEITTAQFSVLSKCLRFGPLTITGLAEHLELDRTTLTRNLRLLEKRGLVSIEKGADKRSRRVEVTMRGKKTLEIAKPLWEEAQSTFVHHFGKERWKILLSEFRQINQIVREEF